MSVLVATTAAASTSAAHPATSAAHASATTHMAATANAHAGRPGIHACTCSATGGFALNVGATGAAGPRALRALDTRIAVAVDASAVGANTVGANTVVDAAALTHAARGDGASVTEAASTMVEPTVSEPPRCGAVLPAAPAIDAAPAQAATPGEAASVPARPMPAVEVEAVIVAFVHEDRGLLDWAYGVCGGTNGAARNRQSLRRACDQTQSGSAEI